MSDYLLINILVISVPLLLSFENKIKFYRKIPFIFISFLVAGGAFIFWDAVAASRGNWSFNPAYINGIEIVGLPIEELLFFVTIPYSCIFLYETARYYLIEKEIKINRFVIYFVSFVLITIALVNSDREYTFLAFFISGIFLITVQIFASYIYASKIFWLFILFSFIPFLAVNYLLTSFPIVIYNPVAFLGFRIITIPIEDFFYSFTMISFYLLIYLTSERIWIKRKKSV